jgi:N-acetylneuraminate synthase
MPQPTKVIAEIGINHNGSVKLAKKLIDVAVEAGADFAKFQKRNPDVCVPEEQKSKLRETPWGKIPYIDYKYKIEFGAREFDELFRYAEREDVKLFASVWDLDSVEFMAQRTDVGKIGSALITNEPLLKATREAFDTVIISTGMSTEQEIENAISLADPDVVMHSVSSYPTLPEDLNLEYVKHLYEKFGSGREIGYSGHEMEIATSVATVPMGASWVERHLTLDREMWGSDQSSSLEPEEFKTMVEQIRLVERSMGGYGPRVLLDEEKSKRKSLRGV